MTDINSVIPETLLIDYSSASSKLVLELRDPKPAPPMCNWIMVFVTGRPQVVTMGSNTSSTLILNTGAPQGCCLSPRLYSLFTHDCSAIHGGTWIINFVDCTSYRPDKQ